MFQKKNFFDKLARQWDTEAKHNKTKIEYLLDSIPVEPASKILDVGTGTGVLIPFFMNCCNSNCSVTAIDFSQNMIARAKEKHQYSNVEFIIKDVYTLDNSFRDYDLCICYSVFPHFDYKKKVIKILSKCLKKGGKLVIAHSQSRDDINNLHRRKNIAVKFDKLPHAQVLSGYLDESNFNTVKVIDNNEMYLVVGEKR